MAAVFVLVAMGGFAADLSVKANRGQELQNAADAAALAAVHEWNLTGNTTDVDVAITAMLNQNGQSSLTYNVDYISATELKLTVADPTFTGVFSLGLSGSKGIERDATARQDICVIGCNQVVEAPRILYPISAVGDGDGFLPIEVGERYYSINHHEDTVDCVDKVLNAPCFNKKPAFGATGIPAGTITADMHHPQLVGNRIYYTGHPSPVSWGKWLTPPTPFNPSAGMTVLTCFDTTTDAACTNFVNVGTSIEGHGVMAVVGTKIYVFTSSRKVFCYQTPSLNQCGNYAGGRVGPLPASDGSDTWQYLNDDEASAFASDIRVHGTKIYSTIYGLDRTWIQCWDTAGTGGACAFGAKEVPNSAAFGKSNRIFFNRDSAGTPNGVCVLGREAVACYDLNSGIRLGAQESKIEPLRTLMNASKTTSRASPLTPASWYDNGWSGMNSYHAETNRLYTVSARESYTFCYDFDTAAVCTESGGITRTIVGGVPTETYGYISDSANCMIGLGDRSIFHTMKPDLSGPCDSSGGTRLITSCSCPGTPAVWPELEAVTTTGVTDFRVRVTDPAGNPVSPTTNADDWHDLLVGPLDLSGVGTFANLIVHFDIVVDPNQDPWAADAPPTFIIKGKTIPPHLIG